MLESLVMAQQFEAARQFLQQAPHLHSNDLLRQYARHASISDVFVMLS